MTGTSQAQTGSNDRWEKQKFGTTPCFLDKGLREYLKEAFSLTRKPAIRPRRRHFCRSGGSGTRHRWAGISDISGGKVLCDSCSPGDGSSVRIILWMCGGCCYNSHLSPRGLVPAFTLKHTSPSLWLLLSLQDACYTENLILYYWQMTKNVIEIEQETQCIEDAVGYRWGQNYQPTFFTLCYSAYTKLFFFFKLPGFKIIISPDADS